MDSLLVGLFFIRRFPFLIQGQLLPETLPPQLSDSLPIGWERFALLLAISFFPTW